MNATHEPYEEFKKQVLATKEARIIEKAKWLTPNSTLQPVISLQSSTMNAQSWHQSFVVLFVKKLTVLSMSFNVKCSPPSPVDKAPRK